MTRRNLSNRYICLLKQTLIWIGAAVCTPLCAQPSDEYEVVLRVETIRCVADDIDRFVTAFDAGNQSVVVLETQPTECPQIIKSDNSTFNNLEPSVEVSNAKPDHEETIVILYDEDIQCFKELPDTINELDPKVLVVFRPRGCNFTVK